MNGSGRTAKEIKEFLKASYKNKPPETIDGWVLDKQLSKDTAKVYYKPQTGEAVVVHRGTKGTADWGNNLAYIVGAYELTPRFKKGKSVQDKAEKKYNKKNIDTIAHSQGSIIARKVGADTRSVINVNPAYTFEKPSKNEYNIRSSSDVVSGLYAPVAKSRKLMYPKYSKQHDITIPSKNITDIKGEHSYNILERLGDTEIGVETENKIYNNNMNGGTRYNKLPIRSSNDIDWYGGKRKPNIGKAFDKVGKAFSTGASAVNPITYMIKDKKSSKAMASTGQATHDYILPATVSVGKPIYDATAITASTALTGNPVLGKAIADTLWNQMVAKPGIDPRQNQKSKELGEIADTLGKALAKPYSARMGGPPGGPPKRTRLSGRGIASSVQRPNILILNQELNKVLTDITEKNREIKYLENLIEGDTLNNRVEEVLDDIKILKKELKTLYKEYNRLINLINKH